MYNYKILKQQIQHIKQIGETQQRETTKEQNFTKYMHK